MGVTCRPWGRRSRAVLAGGAVGILFALWAGPASADEIGTDCPPPAGRQFCITIADTDGVSPSPDPAANQPPNRMRFVVTVRNVGGSTLTHALLTTELADLPAGTSGTTARLVSITPEPAGIACLEPSPGAASCDIGRLVAGASFTATLVYTTSHTEAVEGTRLTAIVSVDEHERDQGQPRDPNQERRTAVNVTSYETSPDFGASFVPAEAGDVRVVTSRSSLAFSTPGFEPFFAEIQDYGDDRGHCFTGVTCLAQTTRGDLTDTAGGLGPILWQRRLTNVPKTVSASSIESVHFYDPVSVTVDPGTDTFTSPVSFLEIDGVRFTAGGALPGGLSAGRDYFVVRATATSFKVSTRERGKPVNITSAGSGGLSAERVRVIGDAKSERWSSCDTPPGSLPAIVGIQVSRSVIDTCVWTSENGWMK